MYPVMMLTSVFLPVLPVVDAIFLYEWELSSHGSIGITNM